MTKEETINKINEVKQMKLPHMTYAKVKQYHYGNILGFEETEENIKIMDEYFYRFLDPKNEQFKNGCWVCGNKDIYLSWGITHGIAHSNCCGLSYNVLHYPKDICKDKKLFDDCLKIILQYHPEGFEVRKD